MCSIYPLVYYIFTGAGTSGTGGSGATHAGQGGKGQSQPAEKHVGDIFAFSSWGSGGGSYSTNAGGRGGGGIFLTTNDFDVDGSIKLDGLSGGVSDLLAKYFLCNILVNHIAYYLPIK